MRTLLLISVALGWLLVGALALHESRTPVVLGRWSSEFASFIGFFAGVVAVWTTAVSLHLRSPGAVRSFFGRLRARGVVVPLALVGTSLLFTCGVMEGAVRAVDLLGTSLYGEIESYWWDTVPDPELMYRHRPGFENTYQGVAVAYNELGLRERPIGPKRAGRKRVLVLGDSVVFGWGVEAEDTFPRQLEAALGDLTGEPVETINSGVCSYNTEIEFAFLKRHGDDLDPDLVLLLYVHNDTDPTLMPPRDWGTLGRFLEEPVGSLRYFLRRSRVYSVAEHIVPALLSPTRPDPASPGWHASMEAFAEIAAWCEERDIPFAALLYRLTDQNEKDALLLPDLARVASTRGFPFGDTLAWFEGRDLRDITNSFIDSHPNPAGHAILATESAKWLVEELPP